MSKGLTLPTERSAATKVWAHQKFLMIGQGKIGKSEFWAQDPNAFFIETEPGLNHLSVLKLPCHSWEDFRDIYASLFEAAQAQRFPYATVVVDTIDRLINYATEGVISRGQAKFPKADISSIGDIPNGLGWFWLSQMVEMAMSRLEQLPAAIALIGHVNNKEVKEPTRTYMKDTISIGGQTGIKLIHWADHTLHVRSRYVGEQIRRQVRTIPTESLEAGSRGNVVPDGMEWGEDAAENWRTFRALFDDAAE